ncbi:uncharacterized protein LOC111884501 [Lactuca sativa]|uniref:Uncharacterized protein n=1 Tax=Lactuca sativa TaxID=4236 RepID=A0A9R1WS74_LACSA|nr:uncharacterized protein LOC111884501 [Lactuca sativa]KAJ0227895.1 hypothetical protein LSAT_V11C100049960 [Lactuca sativa]
MEGVGARLGRSSTRYGPTTVFTGPVRKWKKKWVNVTPPNAPAATASGNSQHHHHQTSISSNGNSSSNSSNDNGAHILLYKWTPIKQSQNPAADNDSNVDAKDDGAAEDVDEEPPRRKIKYIPIALLEEQKKESPEEHIDESVETDPILKDDDVNEKPDINDMPTEENQETEATNIERQDLNESTLDLNAGDGDEDLEETKD